MRAMPDAPPHPVAALPDDIVAAVEDPRIRTVGLLIEAHARLMRDLDRRLRADTGTTLQTLEVLLRVGRSDEGWIPMSQLADTVALTSGGITRLVDRLETEGLVARHRCPSDGRVVRLQLTKAGVQRLRVAIEAHRSHLDDEVGALIDPDDLGALERGLESLRQGSGSCPT